MAPPIVALREAVATTVEAGDTIHIVGGHWRWSPSAHEVARQWWGRDPGFSLVMGSLTSLAATWFRGGLVRRTVTTYSGDSFPTYSPNPTMAAAYRDGSVSVEHWSFLSLTARLRAGALGAPAAVVRSIGGSSMAAQDAYAEVDSPFGEGAVGLVAPLQPDVTLVHAPLADRHGHVAFHPPLLEGLWGAWGARKGCVVTAEKIVDDVGDHRHMVRLLPRHVAAIVEVPMGAHPGGLHVPNLPVEGYGEDIPFWCEIRDACRHVDLLDAFIDRWVVGPADHGEYLDRLGADRVATLRRRRHPESWKEDAAANPADLASPVTAPETAAVLGARHLAARIEATGTDAVLAGAGLANLSAWLGVARAREAGCECVLTAELGLWGYEPTPADPYIFNHRSFPSASMLADADTVLGGILGGRRGRAMACLGAAQIDQRGDINSTEVPGGPFLVGSGGGNDVASVVAEAIVVTTAHPQRLVEEVGFVTSPGHRCVSVIATDLGVMARSTQGHFEITQVVEGDGTVADRALAFAAQVGWDVAIAPDLVEVQRPTHEEVAALRRWDPTGIFLT
ncbi:MAG TPA: CoA-transferase [Acidimicrobiales bacterium]